MQHQNHLVDHHKHAGLRDGNVLSVVGVISNPARWESRYRLARKWIAEMEATPNVAVYVVELAYGDRHHEVTDADNPRHLQLRSSSEIWLKEALINSGVRHLLPRDWKYMAWVDTDISFKNPNWAQETLHKLQHHAVVQPWVNCVDLDHRGNVMNTHTSFGYLQQTGKPMLMGNGSNGGTYPHSGYAWAIRRDLWEAHEGLLDCCILGSADYHLCWGFAGNIERTLGSYLSESYKRRCRVFQKRALPISKGQVGYVDGLIEHGYHGAKADRKYNDRWKILRDYGFDPDEDLVYDSQGLPKLVGKPLLEQAVHRYNVDRREDLTEG